MILTKISHGLIFSDKGKIRILWKKLFMDLLKNLQNLRKLIHAKIKLAKINLREN